MIKNYFLFSLFLIPLFAFGNEGTADSTHVDKKEHKNEIGFDMIYFLNLFRNQYEVGNENYMSFAFDHHLKKERILRFFLNTGLTNFTIKDDTMSATKTVQTDITALPGFGWEKHIGKHWAYFYGLQANIRYSSGKDVRGDNKYTGVQRTEFTNYAYGPSAFTGIKYVINERLSLQLETDIAFLINYDMNSVSNEKYPSQNYKSVRSGYSTEYFVPKTILLNLKF